MNGMCTDPISYIYNVILLILLMSYRKYEDGDHSKHKKVLQRLPKPGQILSIIFRSPHTSSDGDMQECNNRVPKVELYSFVTQQINKK
jgi:hypothetical protein